MTAAREEAAVVAASLAFQTDPAGVIRPYVERAMTAYWQDQPATARHMTYVALLLVEAAANPYIERGASLDSLRTIYGEAPA